MIDITPILQAFVALVVVVISVFVLPYFKSITTAEQRAEVQAWVKIAVAAAEQIFKGAGRGEEKKQYVLEWLYGHGLTVDDSQIDAMIEAAVYELGQAMKK